MNNIIIYLSFLPWVLYFILHTAKAIRETKLVKKTEYFKWLKSHFFQIFRLDNLVLIAVFLYFVKHHNDLVDKMLFSSINLYLFVNSIYDKSPGSVNKVSRSELTLIIILILITTIPFIYFSKTNNLQLTYKIMFGYTFFAYFIVIISKIINMPIVRLVKKKK